MKTVIGLGSVGKNLLEEFSNNKYYQLILIDDAPSEGPFSSIVVEPDLSKTNSKHEAFEREYPHLSENLKDVKEEIYLIVSGASDISGACLSILSHLKEKNVTIVYIKPELEFLSEIEKKQEKITRNVLQEYVRSGLISRIFLLDNARIEAIIGDVSVKDYYAAINKHIAYAFQALDSCEISQIIFGSIKDSSELCKISTLALLTENKKEYPLYSLSFMEKNVIYPLEKTYFFLVSEEKLQEDKTLLKETKNLLRTLKNVDENISFGIYGTKHNIDYKFAILNTSLVQK